MSEVEEAAKQWADRESENYTYDSIDIQEAFQAGAEWLLEQAKKLNDGHTEEMFFCNSLRELVEDK